MPNNIGYSHPNCRPCPVSYIFRYERSSCIVENPYDVPSVGLHYFDGCDLNVVWPGCSIEFATRCSRGVCYFASGGNNRVDEFAEPRDERPRCYTTVSTSTPRSTQRIVIVARANETIKNRLTRRSLACLIPQLLSSQPKPLRVVARRHICYPTDIIRMLDGVGQRTLDSAVARVISNRTVPIRTHLITLIQRAHSLSYSAITPS
ncbi:hypothetical protein P171DRAFT_100465 [Karstenula rhodostoma CBS 690.94]|uniref:Uncharacterized protein n=1 Tax=Karstenula rhodostoma CBS 690.94 TaxID=1392251 RepID=A0A9P4PC77_9PLEO|nr:hypothetical protein P171DRAFT_100465 [Karstenula rhodostoma CBS 690.94]